ncbi:MAG: nucleotidyltransferase family protein [Vulcanimicrobiaceae bacterium]
MDRSVLVRFAAERGAGPRLAMRGTSMLPLLREPYVLELRTCTATPAIGEIVVFTAGRRLVAHRVVGRGAGYVICAGDATPKLTERVSLEEIVGVVCAVRDGSERAARRIDGAAFKVRGALYARTRSLRAAWDSVDPLRRERGFAALFDTVSAIVRHDRAALLRALETASAQALADAARRHRCEPLLANALADLPQTERTRALRARVQKAAWATALRTKRLRAQLTYVLAALRKHGLNPILLKGAARLWSGNADAPLHDSSDLDLLLAPEGIAAACEALRGCGYRQFTSSPAAAAYYEYIHHHAAPLYPPREGVAVELHRALQPRGLVSLPTSYGDVAGFAVCVKTSDGSALTFDRVGTALHLLVHGYRRPELRDIALLATLLREMSSEERTRLQGLLHTERIEPVRTGAMAYAAARCAMIPWPASESIERFFRWMLIREDLPRPLRARPRFIDAWLSARERPYSSALRAAFDTPIGEREVRSGGSRLRRVARPIAEVASACAIALYMCRLSPRT